MAAITSLGLCSPVYLLPWSTINPRLRRRPQSRVSFPAKPFPSLSIRIAASPPTFTPLTPLYPTTRPWSTRSSTLTRLTRPSTLTELATLAESTRSSTLTELTRSLVTLAALATAVVRALAHKLSLAAHTSSHGMGDALRFSLQTGPPGYLNTPQTVVAAVIKKWLDIYSDVLTVRLMLGWFPNLPWERQPLSAIRALCDPYLNLFTNIIPPIFEHDLNPLLAIALLRALGSIVQGITG